MTGGVYAESSSAPDPGSGFPSSLPPFGVMLRLPVAGRIWGARAGFLFLARELARACLLSRGPVAVKQGDAPTGVLVGRCLEIRAGVDLDQQGRELL